MKNNQQIKTDPKNQYKLFGLAYRTDNIPMEKAKNAVYNKNINIFSPKSFGITLILIFLIILPLNFYIKHIRIIKAVKIAKITGKRGITFIFTVKLLMNSISIAGLIYINGTIDISFL